MATIWKRTDYLVHRWLGIALGLLVAVWFVSGIVMMYYPWPAPTETRQFSILPVMNVDVGLIGFAAARRAAANVGPPVTPVRQLRWSPDYVGGRLFEFNGRPAYQLWRQSGTHEFPTVLLDARTGRVLTPISSAEATAAARALVGPLPQVTKIESLDTQDHYLLSAEYRMHYPALVVHFDDPANTAIYVSRASGWRFGVVTDFTRYTTWFGAVPHWLFFTWLYNRNSWWMFASLFLPAVAIVLGLAGMVLGTYQLFPRRRRNDWRPSVYHGVSKWHHLTGIVFGALVLILSLSGALKVLGPDNANHAGQLERTRGSEIAWDRIRVSEAEAIGRLQSSLDSRVKVVAIDLTAFEGSPGYAIHLEGGAEYWVDAQTGATRAELTADAATLAAQRAFGAPGHAIGIERVTQYDTYYYARHGRAMHLPVWRVRFDDPGHSEVYLNTVTGLPVGFVDSEVRTWRWMRDALHDLDLPSLNNRRPLWDLVLLPLMIGSTLIALTGVWLLIRRVVRIVRSAPRSR